MKIHLNEGLSEYTYFADVCKLHAEYVLRF